MNGDHNLLGHAGGGGQSIDPLLWLVPLVVLGVGAGLYLAGVAAYERRRHRRWRRARTWCWLAGTGLVALALSPAVGLFGEGARAHMAQHMALGMFAPLALVLGAPINLLLGCVGTSTGRRITRVLRNPGLHVLGHPVTAAVLNVGSLYVLYLTGLYAFTERHEFAHHVMHVHVLVAGYLFAWSLAGVDPNPRRARLHIRVIVLVLAAAAHSVLAKLMYAGAGYLPPGSSHGRSEMEAAAQWMYYAGDVSEMLLAAMVFAGWYRLRRTRSDRRPPAHNVSQEEPAGITLPVRGT